MVYHPYFFFCYLVKIFYPECGGRNNMTLISNELNEINRSVQLAEPGLIYLKRKVYAAEKVSVRLYYECFCPWCIKFDTKIFAPVVRKLHGYLDIKTYPYGKAKTIERNGTYEFICQHGPEECYGNKLHACALDLIENKTEALLFNSCMMSPRKDNRSSDDVAADTCAKIFKVDASSIKECAKGSKGDKLLKYYGDESKKVSYKHVPYILVNGKVSRRVDFVRNVCAAFVKPPPPCLEMELV